MSRVITLSTDSTVTVLDAVNNYDNVTVHVDYSGRAMFGDTCFGISGDAASVQSVLADALYESGADDNPELINMYRSNAYRQDSLGLGIIVYFPGYNLDPDEYEEWRKDNDPDYEEPEEEFDGEESDEPDFWDKVDYYYRKKVDDELCGRNQD